MGKHKKHHKKRSSHGHAAPAFPYPAPAFYAPQLSLQQNQAISLPSPPPPPSLCVSIDLDSLQQPQPDRAEQRKSHHHHRRSDYHRRTDGGSGSLSDPAGSGVAGERGRPTIPPLRISLHTSSSSLSSKPVGEEGNLTELKVSLPISRLQGEKEEEVGGGRKERERRHKKHKKHKERKRHDFEQVSDGTKPVWLEGERAGREGGERERVSYGGKGLARKSTAPAEVVPGGGGRGGLLSQRPQQGQKEHPLSLSYTSHRPPPSHPSHPHSPPTNSSPPENRFSDKYHQHKKRLLDRDSSSIAPPLPHSSHSSSVKPTHPHPHPLPSSQTTPPEPHRHHKKKKKRKHSKSHSSDRPLVEPQSVSVGGTQSEERFMTPPTSVASSSSLERELVELRPLSPPMPPAHHVERDRGRKKEGGWVAAKRMKLSSHSVPDPSPSTSLTPSSPPTVPAPPLATPTPSLSGKSGWSTTGEATPPKRRRFSSHAPRPGAGKQLRMMEAESDEEEEEEDGGREREEGDVLADYDPPPLALEQLQPSSPQPSQQPQVLLSRASLKMFLANLLRLVQKYDSEGIFAEPVTDDIAPGYSTLIKHPMDLNTMATKLSNHAYSSVAEFRSDFVLMCKNAMTYNSLETVYYSFAQSMVENGLRIIEREVSLRPDMRYGRVATPTNSQTPIALSSRGPSPAPSSNVDYGSSLLCRISLSLLPPTTAVLQSQVVGMVTSPTSSLDILEEVGVASEQSHLTQVVVGVPPEEGEEGEEGPVCLESEEDPAEILRQVQSAAEEAKENLESNKPSTKFCFIRDHTPSPPPQAGLAQEGLVDRWKANMSILNPDSGLVDSSKPLDLTALSERVRAGNNAATVLRTELPMFKATPVSYLMTGPFGSFAPTYDSAFATLTKMDSDLLLHTYGSNLGVSYSHSLLQFVKGAGSFASEMADAVLNSLTAGRHEKFMEKYHTWEERERLGRLKKEEGSKQQEEGEKETADDSTGDSDVETKTEGEKEEGEREEGEGEGREVEKVIESESMGEVTGTGEQGEDGEGVGESSAWCPGEGGEEEEREIQPRSQETSDSSQPASAGQESSGGGLEEAGESEATGETKSEVSSSPSPSQEGQEVASSSPASVGEGLSEGAHLISDLQTYQWERLSETPSLDQTGHTTLPPPSQLERETATNLATQLAALTAQVRPGDMVGVSSLRQAMGLPPETSSPPPPPSLPSSDSDPAK